MTKTKISADHTDRLSAEKAFHNARFSSDPSAQPGTRYYLALEKWYQDYHSCVTALGGGHILEMGAGTQSLALQIDHANFEFNSIDISEEAIAFAQQNKRLPQARFSVDDAHRTQFPTRSFDLIIGRGILHHLDIPVACTEIKRLLKPGGRIVFGEPLDCNVLINFYRKLTPNIRSRDERPLSREALNLLHVHFGKLDIRYYGFLTLGLAVFGLKSPRLVHELDRLLLNTLGLGRFFAWACLISTISSPRE